MNNVKKMIALFDEECKLRDEQSFLERGGYRHLSDSKFVAKRDGIERRLNKNYEKQKALESKMTYEEKEELYMETEINLNEDEL